jgi:hypothetical protein
MTHAAPGQVGDVQQAVDAAEIDEGAVIGDVFDHASDDGTFLQRLEQLGALLALASLDHGAARQHDVVALAVELDDLELHGLVFVRRGVLHRAGVDQRAGKEGADAVDHHGQPALDLAGGRALDELTSFQRLFQRQPRRQALGLVTRQHGVATTVFQRFDRNGDEIADLDFGFTLVVVELFDRDVGVGLQPGVDHDEVLIDRDHFGGDDFAGAQFACLQGLFKQCGKRLVAGGTWRGSGHEVGTFEPRRPWG